MYLYLSTFQYLYESMECHFKFEEQVTIWYVKYNIPIRMLR